MAFDNQKWGELIVKLKGVKADSEKYMILDQLLAIFRILDGKDKVESWNEDLAIIKSAVNGMVDENWKKAAENKIGYLQKDYDTYLQKKKEAAESPTPKEEVEVVAAKSPTPKEEVVAAKSPARKEEIVVVESSSSKKEAEVIVSTENPTQEIDVTQFIHIPRDLTNRDKTNAIINGADQLTKELAEFAASEDSPFSLIKPKKTADGEVPPNKPGLFRDPIHSEMQAQRFMDILYRCDFAEIDWEKVFITFEAGDETKERYNFLQVFLAGANKIPPLQQQWFFAKLIEEIGQKRFYELYTQDFVEPMIGEPTGDQPPIKSLGSLEEILANHKKEDSKTREDKTKKADSIVTKENRNAVTTVNLLAPMFDMVLVAKTESENKEKLAKTQQDLLVTQIVAEIFSFRTSGGAFNASAPNNYFQFKMMGLFEPDAQKKRAVELEFSLYKAQHLNIKDDEQLKQIKLQIEQTINVNAVEARLKEEFVNEFGLNADLLDQAWDAAVKTLQKAKENAAEKTKKGLDQEASDIIVTAQAKALYVFVSVYISQHIAKKYFSGADTAAKARLALLLTDKSFAGVGVLNYFLSGFSPINDEKGPDVFVADFILALLQLDTSIAVSPTEILDLNTMTESRYPYNNALTALGNASGTKELFAHLDKQVTLKQEALVKLTDILKRVQINSNLLEKPLTTYEVVKLTQGDLQILVAAKFLPENELKIMQEILDDKAFLQKELGGELSVELSSGAKVFVESVKKEARAQRGLDQVREKLSKIDLELTSQQDNLAFLEENFPKIKAFFKEVQALTQESTSQSYDAAKEIHAAIKINTLQKFLERYEDLMTLYKVAFYKSGDSYNYKPEAMSYLAIYFKEIPEIVSNIREIKSWLKTQGINSEKENYIDRLALSFEQVPYISNPQKNSSQAVNEYLERMCIILETFYSPPLDKADSKNLEAALSENLGKVIGNIEQQKQAGNNPEFIKHYNAAQAGISAKLDKIVSYLPKGEESKFKTYQNMFATQISESVHKPLLTSGGFSSSTVTSSNSNPQQPVINADEKMQYHASRAIAIITACSGAAEKCLYNIQNPSGAAKAAYTFIPDKMMTRESKHAKGKKRAEDIRDIFYTLENTKVGKLTSNEQSSSINEYAAEKKTLEQLSKLIDILYASTDKEDGGGYTSKASLNFHLGSLLDENAVLFDKKFNDISGASASSSTDQEGVIQAHTFKSEGKEKDVTKLLANAEATFDLLKQELKAKGVNVDKIQRVQFK